MTNKRLEYFDSPRNEMLEFIPSWAKTSLEVGCGTGRFSAKLRELGITESWGIEIDIEAASQAKKQLDHVLVGPIEVELQALPEEKFDIVIFNDVLEHLLDPFALLPSVRKLLSKRGVIVASIPNVRHIRNLWNLLIKKDWRYEQSGVLDRTHLRFFTEKSIRRMFFDAGYEISCLDGISRSRHPLIRSFDLLTFRIFHDTVFLQFACVAKPRR